MSARRILLVAILALIPAVRLPAQFGVPGPYIALQFFGDPTTNCGAQFSAPYNASRTVCNTVGGLLSASAAITPGGPTGSVFTQASFSGNLAPNSYADAESLASLEEEIWFTTGNPNDIFSVAVGGLLQWTQSPFVQGTLTQQFATLIVGTVDGGQHHQRAAAIYDTSAATFNVAIQARNPGSDPPSAFFFRLQTETIVVANTIQSSCPSCPADVAASAFADPFVTFYDEDGSNITGNYTLSYIPAPFVVVTPEPATFATALTGLLGVTGFANRRRRTLQTLRDVPTS